MSGIVNFFYNILLLIDGEVYQILSHTYKLFNLVCQINMSSVTDMLSPLINRVNALIIVVIIYKVGLSLINFLFEPEKAITDGGKVIKNIFIAAALLVSYEFIFNFMSDLSVLIIGSSGTYNYKVLNELGVVDNSTEDAGLINRFIFGSTSQDTDAGDFLATEMVKIFIDDGSSGLIDKTIGTSSPKTFTKLHNLAEYVGKNIEYHWGISAIIGIYLVYVIASTSIEIGVRMFKLLVLQFIAPIAILSIITDGVKGKKFSTYVSTYIKIYLEAFIRIASLLITTVIISLFISNINQFFSSAVDEDISSITKALLIIIMVIAGFKFAKELPKFLEEALGTKLSGGSEKGFGSAVLGGILGGGIGAATGITSGIASGAGFGGTIANAVAGGANGATSGFKGKNISDKIKNIGENSKKNYSRATMFARQGGLVASGVHATEKFLGVPQRQQAKESREKDKSTSFENMLKVRSGALSQIASTGSSSRTRMKDSSGNTYSVKYGDSADSYASSALEFDESYQNALNTYQRDHSQDSYNTMIEERKKATDAYKAEYETALFNNDSVNKDRSVLEATKTYNMGADSGYESSAIGTEHSIKETKEHYQKNISTYHNKGANQRDQRTGTFGGK